MKTVRIIRLLALAGILLAGSIPAHAETLSWNAVTTYTDGSAITSSVTYTAIWSTSSSLSSPATLASSISTTSSTFDISTAGMPRGTTIYVAVKATVGGVDSAYSAPLSWYVPTVTSTARKTPSSPNNVRVQ